MRDGKSCLNGFRDLFPISLRMLGTGGDVQATRELDLASMLRAKVLAGFDRNGTLWHGSKGSVILVE